MDPAAAEAATAAAAAKGEDGQQAPAAAQQPDPEIRFSEGSQPDDQRLFRPFHAYSGFVKAEAAACCFAEKARFFRSLWAGRHRVAVLRFTFFKVETL